MKNCLILLITTDGRRIPRRPDSLNPFVPRFLDFHGSPRYLVLFPFIDLGSNIIACLLTVLTLIKILLFIVLVLIKFKFVILPHTFQFSFLRKELATPSDQNPVFIFNFIAPVFIQYTISFNCSFGSYISFLSDLVLVCIL